MRAGERASIPEDDHVHFREVNGTSAVHDATRKLTQMLFVELISGQRRGKRISNYQPNLEETATSLDEVGLGVHLYWAMEFDADGARLQNEDMLRTSAESAAVMPDLRGHFAGGNQPHGWTTSRSFVDPTLTEASTTDLFGVP